MPYSLSPSPPPLRKCNLRASLLVALPVRALRSKFLLLCAKILDWMNWDILNRLDASGKVHRQKSVPWQNLDKHAPSPILHPCFVIKYSIECSTTTRSPSMLCAYLPKSLVAVVCNAPRAMQQSSRSLRACYPGFTGRGQLGSPVPDIQRHSGQT